MPLVAPELLPAVQVIESLCRRWKIEELSLFGSMARGEAGPTSDADVLVSFQPGERWSLWDLVRLRDELTEVFGREVDLVEQRALTNPYGKAAILRDKLPLYVA
jgi:hypothetical protein